MAQSLCHARIEKRVRVILRKSNTIGRHQEIIKDVSLKLGYSNRYQRVQKETHLSRASSRQHLPSASISASLNFSAVEKIKAALHGIKVVSSISYAKGEERPYGNRVYNRTNGISATGAAPSDREI